MARVDGIIKKFDGALRRLDSTDRVVYKRVITRSGGDDLIGKYEDVVVTDTLLDPQPLVRIYGSDATVGNDFRAIVLNNGAVTQLGDYIISASPTSITQSDLDTEDMCFVLKSGQSEEELFIVGYRSTPINGRVAMFKIVARSKGRSVVSSTPTGDEQ